MYIRQIFFEDLLRSHIKGFPAEKKAVSGFSDLHISDSIEKRFKTTLSEYRRIFPRIKYKDKVRLFNEEQKVRIYFEQECLCAGRFKLQCIFGRWI